MRKTSAPRTFSSSWKWISPSEKRWNLHSPSGTPRNLQISSESARLAEPEKILKRLSSESFDGLRAAAEAGLFDALSAGLGPGSALPEAFSELPGIEPERLGEFGMETAVVSCSLTLETPQAG